MKKTYTGVDVFKLIAALGVVAIHTNVEILKTIGRLGVPFFIIISSFFFFRAYFSLDRELKKKRLLRFEKRIILLLLYWDIIYLPLAIKHIVHNVELKNPLSVMKFIFSYFLYPVHNANGWGASWYLVAVLIAFPVFIYIKKYINSIVIGAVFSIIELYYILASEFHPWTHLKDIGIYSFVRVLIYVFMGYILAEYYLRWDKRLTLRLALVSTGIMLLLFMIENVIISVIGGSSNSEEILTTVPTSLFITILSLKWNPQFNTFNIRKLSIFIYCIQGWLIALIRKVSFISMSANFRDIIVFILVILSAIFCFYTYKWIEKKTNWKWLNYLT